MPVGDANFDGLFNSTDLVQILEAGKYEQRQLSAGWGEGDWNGDGIFDSGDFLEAFATYNYTTLDVGEAVPEPQQVSWVMIAILATTTFTIRRKISGTCLAR